VLLIQTRHRRQRSTLRYSKRQMVSSWIKPVTQQHCCKMSWYRPQTEKDSYRYSWTRWKMTSISFRHSLNNCRQNKRWENVIVGFILFYLFIYLYVLRPNNYRTDWSVWLAHITTMFENGIWLTLVFVLHCFSQRYVQERRNQGVWGQCPPLLGPAGYRGYRGRSNENDQKEHVSSITLSSVDRF